MTSPTATLAPSRAGEADMATGGRGRASCSEVEPTSRLTEVDLWSEQVDGGPEPWALADVLDEDELARARRFRFDRDRARFVARRALLRRLLAAYTDLRPEHVRYRVSVHRRPELDPRFGLSFSTSHSDGLAVVAITRGPRVGVDLERSRIVPEVVELADGVLSRAERAHVLALEEPARSDAFLRIWTRKEACAKALGTGLSMALDELRVGYRDRIVRPITAEGPFALATLDWLPGYVGSVAVAGSAVVVRRRAQLAMAS